MSSQSSRYVRRKLSRKSISRSLRMESLESRQLMAANITANLNLSDKILRIEGTLQSDTIEVTNNAGNFAVRGISINLSDGRIMNTVPRSMVSSISIMALDGDDLVSVLESNITGNKAVPATIDGGNGLDTLSGTSRNDNIKGGNGNDVIDGLAGDDFLDGGANDDSLRGGLGKDRMYGRDGRDTLWGEEGNDLMDGGTGDDILKTGSGVDSLVGGAGSDKLTAEVTFGTLTNSSFTYFDSLQGDLTSSVASIESADIQAVSSGFAYTSIDASLFIGRVQLTGSPITDYLTGGSNADTLLGNDGNDWLVGNGGNDSLDPGVGIDQVDGGSGIDQLVMRDITGGNLSNSSLQYTSSDNLFLGQQLVSLAGVEKSEWQVRYDPIPRIADTRQFTGDVSIVAAESLRTIMTGPGNDVIYGSDFDDTIMAGGGNDIVYGLLGRDVIFGEDGQDTICGDTGADFWGDNDQLFGGEGLDLLYGNGGNDSIWGEAGTDHLSGGFGNDKLFGNGDLDMIYGGLGDDFIDAGSPTEATFWGEEGNDFNAYKPIVDGAVMADIQQMKSPTCWIASSLASAAKTGVDLQSKIQYRSNGVYAVKLFERIPVLGSSIAILTEVFVKFDGDLVRNSKGELLELAPHANNEGDSWATIFQRAYLQSRGLDLRTVGGGSSMDVLFALTGRETKVYGYIPDTPANISCRSLTDSDAWTMFQAVAANKNVTAATEATVAVHDSLINWHVYTVVNMTLLGFVNNEPLFVVTVFNPHGHDGGTASGDPNDGLISLPWNTFRSSFAGYEIN